jgi:predicted DNA repair protein MutK
VRSAQRPSREDLDVPGSSLLSLLDDVASFLDDIAVMTKVAAKKTAGVLGDDLALNAQQVSGVSADRELPVVWAVAKGSLVNKAILVPLALAISAFAPWLVTPLLMVGGAYLCYEGVEKLAHRLLHGRAVDAHRAALAHAAADPTVDLVALERRKIRGAVRTDFVLSSEIIVIALGTVSHAPFVKQVGVLCGIALAMTVGVYGLVAGIVKMDDAGVHLVGRTGRGAGRAFARGLGRGLLAFAPRLMRSLAVIGVVAMFLVGGGILAHGIPGAHDTIHAWTASLAKTPWVGPVLGYVTPHLLEMGVGALVGAAAVAVGFAARRLFRRREPSAEEG